MNKYWCFWITLLFWGVLFGQSNFQQRELTAGISPQRLDSLSILPGSVLCIYKTDTLSRDLYRVNYMDKTIFFRPEISGLVLVKYLRLTTNLSPKQQL